MGNPIIAILNRLLPFATPGTPLLQDLLHLAALCGALYFAPQIQVYIQGHFNRHSGPRSNAVDSDANGPTRNETHIPPRHTEPADANPDFNDNEDDVEEDEEDPLDHPHQNVAFPDDDGAPGPAADPNIINPRPGGPAGGPAPNTRTVGAKKAKSLARRDQRRAYHEFQRSRGEEERLRLAAEFEERKSELEAERARRAAVEVEVREREVRQREERRNREEQARIREVRQRERAVGMVREGLEGRGRSVELAGVVKAVGREGEGAREWIEGLVRASGMLGRSADGDSVAMLTDGGWVVRVGREDVEEMTRIAARREGLADQDGRVGFAKLGQVLENVVRSQTAVAR